jgi:Ankyrin repeats (3 copies)
MSPPPYTPYSSKEKHISSFDSLSPVNNTPHFPGLGESSKSHHSGQHLGTTDEDFAIALRRRIGKRSLTFGMKRSEYSESGADLAEIRRLLELGAKPNNHHDLATEAVWENDIFLLRLLIEYGLNVDLRDKLLRIFFIPSGYTLLHEACGPGASYSPNIELVELLIEHGADVNARERLMRQTPLLLVCEHAKNSDRSIDIARLLITNGADVFIKDRSGKNCLHYAQDESLRQLLLAERAGRT